MIKRITPFVAAATLASAMTLSGAASADKAKPPKGAAKGAAKKPKGGNPLLGLPELKGPDDNPQTPEKIALGRQLFWDGRLSKSLKMSCESCHQPDKGWADGNKLSTKDDGKVNPRHTPTMLNAAYQPYFYWDGRAPTLEKQIFAAWKGQMGLGDDAGAAAVAKRLNEAAGYKEQFQKVFAGEASSETIVKALAAYVRTLVSGDSKYDRAEAGDKKAYTAAEARGADLFKNAAKCSLCHAGFALSAWEFKNIGIGMDAKEPDKGRGKIANDAKLDGAFKVPTLRNVARTAPYMHDGRFATLEEVVDYFGKPIDNPNLDEKVKGGIALTPAQKQDLVAFLKALDGSLPDGTPPRLP